MVLWQWFHRKTICLSVDLLMILLALEQTIGRDVQPQKERYTPDYNVYRNLSRINADLTKIITNNAAFIRNLKEFKSRKGQTQNVIKVSNFLTNGKGVERKVNVLFSYGEHAREFFPVESILHFLYQLITVDYPETINNKKVVEFLDYINLYIIVTANPDGRQYVEQSKNYCWRGTSSGVDINRNFDWEFGGKGSSNNKKDEEYRGPKAFSEPETHVYRELTERVQFDAFVSFHSGIRQIYIPYADTKSKRIKREPENVEEMLKLAQLLSTVTGKTYRYGKAVDLNDYTADGTVFDYMAGVRKIPFSYAIELWGPDNHKGQSCFDLFNPSNEDFKSALEEVNKLYPAFFKYLLDWKRRKSKQLLGNHTTSDKRDLYLSRDDEISRTNSHVEMPPTMPGFLLLFVLMLICFLFYIHGKFPVFRRLYSRRRIVSLRSLGSSFATNMFST